ncbi:MAG TPA: AraC family transcriptional regulator [Bryobacteraceae bacterium]|nr:AraC family transcriptional regulator [Bryobacteraceae bacterium]
MLTALRKVQPVFAFVSEHLDEDVSLAALARQSGLSVFHLHRVFRRTARETPKQFSLRLRLERSAVMLLLHRDSVLDVALDCGFQSHEVFCRAFRKRFGVSPGWYRKRGFRAGADAAQAEAHAALVRSIGPCVGLMRWSEDGGSRNKMEYSITKKMLNPQPVLIVRRRVKPDEIANTLAQTLGQVFLHAQQNGMAIAGQPFTRYLEWGPGLLTIEAGLPVAAHAGVEENGDVRAGTLAGGWAAVTTHAGPYDQLAGAHAAVQQWIETEGLTAHGAPWEVYVTDPADYPDPKEWRTEIFWPVA